MLSLLEPSTIIRVQTWQANASVPTELQRELDAPWPGTAGKAVIGSDATALCISPCEWLLMSSGHAIAALCERLGGTAFRATDVSAALTRLRLEGTHARTVLAKGCSLDLHPGRFGLERVARTRFAGMPVIIRRAGDCAFELIVVRSYGQYLTGWITDATAGA